MAPFFIHLIFLTYTLRYAQMTGVTEYFKPLNDIQDISDTYGFILNHQRWDIIVWL